MIDDTLYDAFDQRQIAQYFTQLSSYYVILEVLPSLQGDPATLEKIFLRSPTTNGEVPLSAFAKWTTHPVEPCRCSHQGSSRRLPSASTLPREPAWPGHGCDRKGQGRIKRARDNQYGIPGQCAGISGIAFNRSTSDFLAALIVVYLILRILYESYIHPITILSTLPSAGVGALLMLMIFHFDFSLVALIGIILLIGIVKKKRGADGRLCHRCDPRRWAVASRRHPACGVSTFSSDYDDDDGCYAGWRAADVGPRHGLRDSSAARLRDGWRLTGESGADAVHDARDLSLSGSTIRVDHDLGAVAGQDVA